MRKTLLILVIFICPFFVWSEFVPYQGQMHSLKTEHFYVIYPKQFQDKAKTVCNYAESIFENLQSFMQWKPRRRITVILTDHTDVPNGLATTFPENTIYLYMAQSGLSDELRDFANPLYSLILHELTHILQLDQIRQGAWFWRIFFSRAYFPLTGAFTWFHEGTAVYSESHYGAGGRLDSIKHKAIIDSFARNRCLPDYEKIVYPIVDYPYNCLAYHLGASFLDYLADVYTQEKLTEFQKDLSNDFWPFIYEFVLKFKKHYGKSLKELWNDWRNWHYSRVEKTVNHDEKGVAALPTYGNLNSMLSFDNDLIFSTNSLKNGKRIFRWNVDSRKKEKLTGDTATNMCLYKDNILCIRNTLTLGGFDCNDIYLFSIKKKRWKRLTYNKRITRMTYNETANIGVYFRDKNVFVFSLENEKIRELYKIDALNSFEFVSDFHLSPDANKLLFSAQNSIDENFLICLYDLKNETTEILPEIRGTAGGWLDSNNIYFVGITADGFTKLFSYDTESSDVKLLFTGNDFVNQAKHASGETFYVGVYTLYGMEIRLAKTDNNKAVTDIQWRIEPEKPQAQKEAETNNVTSISGLYNPARYLNPSWMILPYTLNYSFPLANINIPYITGGINLYKTLPLGRFSYSLSVILDYINWYPQSNLSLIWKIPCTSLGLGFATLRDKDIFQFDNQFFISPTFTFNNENTFSFKLDSVMSTYFSHVYNAVLFTHLHNGLFQYSYLRKHPAAATWNSGMVATLSGNMGFMEKDLKFAAVLFNIETRIPLEKHYFYLNSTIGYNLLSKENIFNIGNQIISIGNATPLSYKGGNFSKNIEMKSFSMYSGHKANVFLKSEIGAVATLYRRSHYWNFLTFGFHAIHLRPFAEYCLIRNLDKIDNLIGTGLEIIADFFVAYANIPFSIVQGNAVGYKIGKSYPVYNGYLALNISI